MGTGVICETRALEAAVIPAKAGIQSVDIAFPEACGVDSRFRGNDLPIERDPLPNDTTTSPRIDSGPSGVYHKKPE